LKPVMLSEGVRLIANAASTDKEGNPVLRGVLVTEDEAIASNGIIVVIKKLPQEGMSMFGVTQEDGVKSVIIPSESLKACAKGEVELNVYSVEKQDQSHLLGSEKLDHRTSIRLVGEEFDIADEAIDGEYIDYRKYFVPSPIRAVVAMNSAQLKKLLKSLPDDATIEFRISDPDRPVEVQCADADGGDFPQRGLIPTCHIDWRQLNWRTEEKE
jgi:hypothetical protein